MTPRQIAEGAFNLHKKGLITRKELVHILEVCIDAAAVENGYAAKYGLPSEQKRGTPKRRST